MTRKPKVGTWVRLAKGRSKKVARVEGYIHGMRGGLVLGAKLDGFRCWNMHDVMPASKPSRNTR